MTNTNRRIRTGRQKFLVQAPLEPALPAVAKWHFAWVGTTKTRGEPKGIRHLRWYLRYLFYIKLNKIKKREVRGMSKTIGVTETTITL